MTGVLTGASIPAMGSLGDRLLKVMALRGISASKLSLDAGLSRTAVQKIIDRGGARTSAETISKIAATARVNREWLETGRGDAELALDEGAPGDRGEAPVTFTDDSTPVMENVPGYLDVEAVDRKAHPEVEDEFWLMGRRAGPLMIVGPAAPGDAYRLAKLAKDMRSPERLAWLLAERDRRIKALQGELEAERAKQHAAIAKKLAKQQGK